MIDMIPPIPYQTPMVGRNGLISAPWASWFRQMFSRIGGNNADILFNPMQDIGDLIYGAEDGAPTRLAADLTDTRKFLRTLSVGALPTAPVWDTLIESDIPALPYVTSVDMSVPATLLSVSGVPITSSGIIALALVAQVANRVFAGPSTGANAAPTFRALVAADIPGGLPYVTSVDMSVPSSLLSVSGNPITSAGTLALALIAQVANRVFAGPSTGADAAPTFRALVAADIPALAYVTSVALTVPSFLSVSGSPITSSGTLEVSLATQTANTIFSGPSSGGAATPTFRAMVLADAAPVLGQTSKTISANTSLTAGYVANWPYLTINSSITLTVVNDSVLLVSWGGLTVNGTLTVDTSGVVTIV